MLIYMLFVVIKGTIFIYKIIYWGRHDKTFCLYDRI